MQMKLIVAFIAALLLSHARAQQAAEVAASPCSQPFDIGTGDASTAEKRYYYLSASGACGAFLYLGAGGNANNFKTLDECQSKCQTAAASPCSLPFDIGTGDGFSSENRYYYNSESSTCQLFLYQGAGGNANNFPSLSECQSTCQTAATSPCSQSLDFGTGDGSSSVMHYYYDSFSSTCKIFLYQGAGGNANNFNSLAECQNACQTAPASPCFQTTDHGTGDGSSSETRYYYNSVSDTCMPFTYQGTGGNANNFQTLAECQNTCPTDEKKPTRGKKRLGGTNGKKRA